IANFAQAYLNDPNFERDVVTTLNNFETALRKITEIKDQFNRSMHSQQHFNKVYPQRLFLTKFCNKFDFHLNLSNPLSFIVESYFLHETKEEQKDSNSFYSTKEVTSIENVLERCRESNVKLSNSMLNNLVAEVQRDLAQVSVNS